MDPFDGHNDAVQHLMEYRQGGRDFLNRSDEGRPDLPRAREGGLVGGLFANPAREPSDDQAGHLARSLTARRKIES
jgi:membrane dipeptidase